MIRFAAGLLLAIAAGAAHAQDFTLLGATTGVRATATVGPGTLTIVQAGVANAYQRDVAHDAPGYSAYSSRRLQQIIRWPRSGRGAMQLGTLTSGGLAWSTSDMQVAPAAGSAAAPVAGTPAIGTPLPPQRQLFDLLSPGRRDAAVLTASELSIIQAGVSEPYRRNPNYDAPGYLGFSSRRLQCAIRWPASGSGKMEIGQLVAGAMQWRASVMTVSPRAAGGAAGGAPAAVAGGIDTRVAYRLTTELCEPLGLYLAVDANGNCQMSRGGLVWSISSLGNGVYQLTTPQGGRPRWLSTGPQTVPGLSLRGTDVATQWTFTPAGRGAYRLESMQPSHRGLALDTSRNGAARFLRAQDVAGQRWKLAPAAAAGIGGAAPGLGGAVIGAGRPRVVGRELVANEPLGPARVELFNGHDRELWVLLTDLRNATASQRIRIPAGQSVTVALDRDAGSSLIATIQYSAGGVLRTRQQRTPQPPRRFYDISVYTLRVQSIARDSTQSGRGQVEDVTYSPQSLGMIEVPAGAAMDSVRADIYAAAKKRGNPGAVRRIDPRQWKDVPVGGSPAKDPFDQ